MKALSVATAEPDSLVLIVSPAQRLSDEFVRRARTAYGRIENAPALIGDAARRIELENKSRILALPGDNDGDTLRGLANVRLAIIDETSRCLGRADHRHPAHARNKHPRPARLFVHAERQARRFLRDVGQQRPRLAPHPRRVGVMRPHHARVSGS
ncbi:hypothetical protein ACVWXO_009150 [Bradyrhizobium sp. LM2.7]